MNYGKAVLLSVTCCLSTAALAGPVDKFDSREPDADFVSSANINDIERCFIRMDGLSSMPSVYSQPDRPNERMMIWPGANTDAADRADLKVVEGGTHVKTWKVKSQNAKAFDLCAPALK